jgi:peptidylprolyl isomerase
MPQSRRRKAGGRAASKASSRRKGAASRGGQSKRSKVVAAIVIISLAAAGAAYLFVPGAKAPSVGAEVTTPSGLRYADIVVGDGPSPQTGQTAVVHYTGTLTNGVEFDGSRRKGRPYEFPLGRGEVIRGWDEGVATMKVGGRRRLTVPPQLGYGERGRPPSIPPNTTLVFDIELLGVK